MRRVVIVHGWQGFPENCWYSQVKKELENYGFEVFVPQMPNADFPQLGSWLNKLQTTAGQPNNDLFLIGHSLGCAAILRYLEKLKENDQVGGVVMVAGFSEDLGQGYEALESFFKTPIHFEKIVKKSKYFTAIHSDNDKRVPSKFGQIFKEKLGAKLLVLHDKDHFSNSIRIISSLPEVTHEILRMNKG